MFIDPLNKLHAMLRSATYVLFGALFALSQSVNEYAATRCRPELLGVGQLIETTFAMSTNTAAFFWQPADQDLFRSANRDLQVGSLPTANILELHSSPMLGTSGLMASAASSLRDARSLNIHDFGFGSLNQDDIAVITKPVSELVFIDRSVNGWEQLYADLQQQREAGRNLDVVLLDSARDGVRQISDSLAAHSSLQSIHIVSHGMGGSVQLGSSSLNEQSLTGYAAQLNSWSDGLGVDADILFYGCDLGSTESGKLLTETIHVLTGADVASSVDLTGSFALGGDWDLEYEVGVIESDVVFSAELQADWEQVLQVNIDQAWLDSQGAGPYYLDQQGETYVLQTDVTTDGTAFAIIAKDVTFDLNGHTITYDNAAPIEVLNNSFETGAAGVATGWDFSNAANADRYQGVWLHNEVYDGDYSARFGLANGDQYITSSSTITLLANTTYSLSGMFEFGGQGRDINPGVEGYIELTGDGLPTRRVAWDTTNYRGIQLRENEFTTGATAETYTIKVGVNLNGNTSAEYFFIDDLKIQQTKVYGVFAGPAAYANTTWTDLDQFGDSASSTITNGVIRQGANSGTWSHGVMVHQGNNININGLNVTVQGANSSALLGFQQNHYLATIDNNNLTSNVKTITSRDNDHGTVLNGFQGTISNNVINNGPITGIKTLSFQPSQVFGNTIRLKARYTNAFAIIGAAGTDIYNNVIDVGTGEYTARGLRASGTETDTALVYGNTIRMQILDNNQEYEGVQLGGGYGMQLEGVGNIEVYENQVYAYANGVEGHAFRANSLTGSVYVHDNEFHAISDGTALASVIKVDRIDPGTVVFEDNSLFTNYALVGGSTDAYLTVTRSNLTVSNPLAKEDPIIFESSYNVGTELNTQIDFLDTTFADPFSRAYLENAVTRSPESYGGQIENRMAFSSAYTTTIVVKDSVGTAVANATVVVVDKDTNEVYSGTADANGQVVVPLSHFRTQGDTKTEFGPYTVTATANGESNDVQFAADQVQTIDVELGGEPPTADYSLTYDGTILTVTATDADNNIVWSTDNPLQFTGDGFQYSVQAGTTEIHFEGLAGNDSIQLTGSAGDDRVNLKNAVMTFVSSSNFKVRAFDIEDMNVDGGDGQDRSYLRGSDADDQFEFSALAANVITSGWSYHSTGFETAVAIDTDGTDTVSFFDSVGDDQFYGYDGYSILVSGDFYLRANDAEFAIAHSDAGGWDKARIFDTTGNDVVTANNEMYRTTDGSQVLEAWNFDRTYSRSSAGGTDTAQLTGGAGNDDLFGDVTAFTLLGDGYLHHITGFASANVDGGEGVNGIYLADSADDDFFQLADRQFDWSASGHTISAAGFTTQVIRSENGGVDTAHFLDTAGDDTFTSYADLALMNAGASFLRVGDFEVIEAFSTSGSDYAVFDSELNDVTMNIGADTVQMVSASGTREAHDFAASATLLNTERSNTVNLTGSEGDDTLYGDFDQLTLLGDGYSNYVRGFTSLFLDASGGFDSFYMDDSSEDDTIDLHTDCAFLVNSQRSLEFRGFETQVVSSVVGGSDTVNFHGSALDDAFYSDANVATMTNSETSHRSDGFANVAAFGDGSGFDTVEIHGTSGSDNVTLSENFGTYEGGGLDRYFENFAVADIYLDLLNDQVDEGEVQYEYTITDEPA